MKLKQLYLKLASLVEFQQVLTVIIGGSGIGWYFLCIVAVGNNVIPDEGDTKSFRSFMSLSITTIGAALATFVGLILGFQVVSRGAGVGAAAAQAAQGGQPAQAVGTTHLKQLEANTRVSWIQWLVAFLYLLSLLVALQMWWKAGDSVDQAVTNLGKSFLGLVGGALSVLLNLPARQPDGGGT
ncbi:MAG TPA: hypothetical protein VD866_12020 [Urbifossiella sp.]|nr:hypothetical protein [Urbifossiella sp.]